MKQGILTIVWVVILSFCLTTAIHAQKFIHPGLNQTSADLQYLKEKVRSGKEPYKSAFERMKASTDLQFKIKPFAHVIRGPYGKPNIGGDDLSKGSEMAYNCALVWYITNDKLYADKAIEIINAWSPVLWDFDYNDAKLLAGWTGHLLCNAAEILKYTNSGWQSKDMDRFTEMLMTVYYPLLRFYYPQANGNWDGAIIHSILAIAIFTDNREMFNNGIHHFLHAPLNGSLFKYIYPSGQCQETMRDQGHVQLGLGEFAGAAQIAYTQGVDLFSVGNNRLALGYEYTAQYLMGKTPHSYGQISDRAKNLRDDYETVYHHYTAMGLDMPYTKMAADSIRPKASRSVLTALRAPSAIVRSAKGQPMISQIGYPAGAMKAPVSKASNQAIWIKPGESIQEALDKMASVKGWVIATAGLHKLPTTLRVPSGVTLSGEGLTTVLFLDPASQVRDAIVNANDEMHDVMICDLVVEGANDPDPGSDPNSRRSYRSNANRGGIIFLGQHEGQMKNITLQNITVRNCTYNGVFISGADNLNIVCCDFNENGSSMVPGPRLQHNLLLTHCSKVSINDSRMDTSPHGCGIALSNCRDVSITNCELARNAWFGILVTESNQISISKNLVEANDYSGLMVQYLYNGSENITISNNLIHYNKAYGIESYSGRNIKSANNLFAGNGPDLNSNEKICDEKYVIMQ